jgi:hypothetical protein
MSLLSFGIGGSCFATFPVRVVDEIVELEIPLHGQERGPVSDNFANRDQPIRWAKRTRRAPISAGSEVS